MFGWLKRKIQADELHAGLSSAFNKVKDDLAQHKKTLDDLNVNHHSFKKSTTVNHQRIAEWITHFDRSIKRLENDLVVLEKKLYSELSSAANASKSLHASFEAHKEELSALKEALKRDLEVFVGEAKLKSQLAAVGPVNNVNNANNVNNVTQEPVFDSLSNPEKWLVGVLFNTETPLSYAQIAEKTGKTVSTVRVYMNQLKIKGFVEESSLPNGVKIFSLKQRAKVKKLYNL